MRVWTKVWIAVAAVCIAATIYEIPNAVRVWRLSYGTMRSARHTGSGKLNIPAVVTDRLIASDPEAGDMLKYLLKYSQQDPNVEELAALVEKYPLNEFLLSQLAEELPMLNLVDPRAALVLVDKLLKLNGENAHYRYLRGWILLTDPDRPGREREALEQFKLGHRLTQFYLPYSKYKDRLDRLYEQDPLLWERPLFSSFYTDLTMRVFHSSRPHMGLDENTFRELSGSVAKIGDRLVENAYDSETFFDGALLLGAGEGTRLKELDLPEPEAHQSRLRAARGLALLDMHHQSFGWEIEAVSNTVGLLGVPQILLLTAIAFLSSVVQEFLQARRNRRKPSVWKYSKVLMFIDAVSYLILILLVVLALLKGRPGGMLYGLLFIMAAIFILRDAMELSSMYPAYLASLQRPRLRIASLCVSLWFTGAVFWTSGSFNVSLPENLTDWLLNAAVLVGWSVFCLLVWMEVADHPDIVSRRHRYAIGLIVYWAVVLMLLHIGGAFAARMTHMFADPLAHYRPLPQATQETYERVVLGRGLVDGRWIEKGYRFDLREHIELAVPDDLKDFIDDWRAARPIPQESLLKWLRNCSRDLRPIFLAELADPNAYDVLIIRAEWGDRSVKDQLERIFQERLATFRQAKLEPRASDPSSLGKLLELAGTLAHISDGPEAKDRFSYLMEQVVTRTRSLGTGPSYDDPRYNGRIMQPFFESLCKLPRAEGTALIKSYLRQTQFVDLFVDRGSAIIPLANLLADADRELAEEVVTSLARLPEATEPAKEPNGESQQERTMRLTRHRNRNTPRCLTAIFAHLSGESIPLLLKYMDSDNDQLRAFVVWRATSLGYKWPREQLDALRKDNFWKVRGNALFARDAKDLTPARDDQSALVRVIAQ